jgi:hypothetical protein
MRRILSVVLGALLFSAAASAGEPVVFGPQLFVRDTGQPRTVTRQFRISSFPGVHLVRVTNRGVTSGIIALNGRVLLAADDFVGRDHRELQILQRNVTLRTGTNQIDVELRSKPGTSLTIEIVTPLSTLQKQAIATGAAALGDAQKPDGGWNAVVGGPDCDCANTIGVDALGLLAAAGTAGGSAALTGAIAAGNRLVAIFTAQPTALPKAQHIEFLAALAHATGHSAYASIASAWFQTTIDRYPDAADRVEALLTLRDSQGFRTLAAWDAASLIRAAKAVGHTAYATAAAAAIVSAESRWKDTNPAHRLDRCSNPSGCGWPGNLLSFDWTMLAEGSLLWAIHDLPSFSDQIAEYRAFLLAQQSTADSAQDPSGSWDAGDLQVTAYALLGLAASGSEGTDPALVAATMFYVRSQLPSGGWPAYVRSGGIGDDIPEIDSEVLQALAAILTI